METTRHSDRLRGVIIQQHQSLSHPIRSLKLKQRPRAGSPIENGSVRKLSPESVFRDGHGTVKAPSGAAAFFARK